MSEIPDSIKRDAQELGENVRVSMDPLCDDHMRKLEYHPTDDEFQNTPIYRKFMDLVSEYANHLELDINNPTIKSELIMEVREFFDQGYYQPADKQQCIGCLEDGEIQIRVSEPENMWDMDSFR